MSISDTTTQAEEVQFDLYRKMSPSRKIELIFDACRTGQLLSMAGIRMQYPSASEEEVWHIWAKRHLGEELYNKVYGSKSVKQSNFGIRNIVKSIAIYMRGKYE